MANRALLTHRHDVQGISIYSDNSSIQHSMGLEKCQSRRLSDYGGTLSITSYMVIAPHKMVELERMSDYRGVRLQRFHVRT